MKRDFLTLTDFSKDEILNSLQRAGELKELTKKGKCPKPLAGKVLALIFEKTSTRTRVSFDVAMYHLGGHSIYLNQQMSQLGRGESYADTARVLSRYVHGIVCRTFSQSVLEELAEFSDVPIINGLTDTYHSCQLMADLMTAQEKGKDLSSMVVSYIGDGNNLTHSWMMAALLFGFTLKVATPKGFEADPSIVQKVKACPNITYGHDPKEAAKDCDVINTDTWFSMGQEVSEEKRQAFWPFQINQDLLGLAKSDVIVLHCLPAHREEEITNEVIDGPHSMVFDEAENRLYAQMAILEQLLKG